MYDIIFSSKQDNKCEGCGEEVNGASIYRGMNLCDKCRNITENLPQTQLQIIEIEKEEKDEGK